MQEQPSLSVVPHVKYEPTDQSDEVGQLKITNVFSITGTNPVVQSTENLDDVSRPLIKVGRKRSGLEIFNDPAREAPSPGRRHGLRKRSVKTYKENSDESDCPSPSNKGKQILKSVKHPQRRPQDINSGRSPAFNRKQTVKTYYENSAEPDCPSPAKISDENVESVINTEEILSCDICSTVFFSVESLEEHVAEVHVVDNEFECSECTKSFISQERLDSHIVEHVKEKKTQDCFKCPICFKTIVSKYRDRRYRHMLTHDVVKPFKCKLCPKSYVVGKDLRRHEMRRHGKPKPLRCPKCPKSYIRKYEMEDHLRTHSNEKTMLCDKCGKAFKTKHSLTGHLVKCKGTKPVKPKKILKCPICSKDLGCFDKYKRRKHVLTHQADRPKPFKCKLCSRSYFKCKDLTIHEMSRHGRPKPFKCPKCPKSYATKSVLEDHLRTHSSDRTVICENCSATFITKNSLRLHKSKCKGRRYKRLKAST